MISPVYVSQYALSVTLSRKGQIETVLYVYNYIIQVDIARYMVNSRSSYPMRYFIVLMCVLVLEKG